MKVLLSSQRETYRQKLAAMLPFFEDLRRIPVQDQPGEACWGNSMMPPLDTVALYSFLRLLQPKLYWEIGSGYSTKIARRAVADGQLHTRIMSIDPHPRAEIDALCNEVIRQPLENVDLSMFEQLQPGDILFFDGSHCCYTNSDVTVFFLEVLPRLRPGVIVQIHDVAWPDDYPAEWENRYYSEQYLLACCLMHGSRFRVFFPAHFISQDRELLAMLDDLWRGDLAGLKRDGMSFWFTIQ